MVILSQYSKQWAAIKLLPSNLTMAAKGCLTVCVCMLSDYYKCFKSPDQVVGINIKYTVDGLMIWESINFPTFKFVKRVRNLFDVVSIDDSIKDPDKAVILAINNDAHWVVALKKLPLGFYLCGNPWGGVKTIISQKIISGSAHFTRIK